jgi:acetylglutamate kinase
MSRLVLKLGGAIAGSAVRQVLELAAGRELVVVHGAGPQITQEMERRRLPVRFVGGRRVTSADALAVVRACYAEVNSLLCAALGPAALGLFGDEIGLRALPVPELGLVGRPLPSPPPAIERALAAGRLPVVAPLAAGPLNVNADEAASALAVGLGAERIVFLTDVPGLLFEGAVLPAIGAAEAERLLSDGALCGGIVPKLRAALAAARLGVRAEIGQTVVSA